MAGKQQETCDFFAIFCWNLNVSGCPHSFLAFRKQCQELNLVFLQAKQVIFPWTGDRSRLHLYNLPGIILDPASKSLPWRILVTPDRLELPGVSFLTSVESFLACSSSLLGRRRRLIWTDLLVNAASLRDCLQMALPYLGKKREGEWYNFFQTPTINYPCRSLGRGRDWCGLLPNVALIVSVETPKSSRHSTGQLNLPS